MKHISFPDIGQYRQLIRNVASHAQYVGKDANGDPIYDNNKPLPVLEFEGTTKLHGTNAAFCSDYKDLWFQSRERLLTIDSDNAGFVRHFEPHTNLLKNLCYKAGRGFNEATVCIYGEWCGSGIQKGVGISTLPKMFVAFAVRVGGTWLDREAVSEIRARDIGIYNIYDYPTWKMTIDFANPIESQNKLVEITQAVEQECPVAKAFGKSGVGEGVVWKCITPDYEDSKFWMKVKGEKHSVSKVTKLASVDMERVGTQNEFVTNTVTEARCLQSISKLKESGKPLDRTSLGDFIKWIFNDIIKEETDTATANGLDISKLGGPIAHAAKAWFFKNENSL